MTVVQKEAISLSMSRIQASNVSIKLPERERATDSARDVKICLLSYAKDYHAEKPLIVRFSGTKFT